MLSPSLEVTPNLDSLVLRWRQEIWGGYGSIFVSFFFLFLLEVLKIDLKGFPYDNVTLRTDIKKKEVWECAGAEKCLTNCLWGV